MSKIKDEIVNKSRDILSLPTPISDEVRETSYITVLTAEMISGKTLSTTAMRRLLSRMETPLTEEEMTEMRAKALIAHSLLKEQNKIEKANWDAAHGKVIGNKYPDALYQCNMTEEGELSITDIDHAAVCKYILNELHIVSFNGTLYVYTDDGTYREDANDISAVIVDILHDRGLKQKETTSTNDITLALKGMNKYVEFPFDLPGNIFLVNNGAIEITKDDVKFTPHSFTYMKTKKLPVSYNKDISSDISRKVLQQWVSEGDFQFLTQIPAQSIVQHIKRASFKHNYLAQGDTDSGKSTYLDLLVRFIGYSNRSGVPLQNICNDTRFVHAELESSFVNIYDDLKDIPLNGSGGLKNLDGSCVHSIERKGRDVYNGVITCQHVFSCNRPPTYHNDLEYDDAWWGRWEFLPFPYTFPKDIGFQERVFTDEFMSSMLNLVIIDIISMFKTNQLPVVTDKDEVKERWSMLSNPLVKWVSEAFNEDDKPRHYHKEQMYAQYMKYAENNNVPIKDRVNKIEIFGNKLAVVGFTPSRPRLPMTTRGLVTETRIHTYVGKYNWVGAQVDNPVVKELWASM
jgi:phage/plasmid-associated DNA primase